MGPGMFRYLPECSSMKFRYVPECSSMQGGVRNGRKMALFDIYACIYCIFYMVSLAGLGICLFYGQHLGKLYRKKGKIAENHAKSTLPLFSLFSGMQEESPKWVQLDACGHFGLLA